MKKILLFLLMSISIFVIYQLQRPILTENNAIVKAKDYARVINFKMNADIDTQKSAEYCVLTHDTVWNKMIGNRQWSVMLDGYVVDIQANTGEFIQMIGPLDGVITDLRQVQAYPLGLALPPALPAANKGKNASYSSVKSIRGTNDWKNPL